MRNAIALIGVAIIAFAVVHFYIPAPKSLQFGIDYNAAEISGPAERLVKAAFRAVAGESASHEQIAKVREVLERALRDLDALSK